MKIQVFESPTQASLTWTSRAALSGISDWGRAAHGGAAQGVTGRCAVNADTSHAVALLPLLVMFSLSAVRRRACGVVVWLKRTKKDRNGLLLFFFLCCADISMRLLCRNISTPVRRCDNYTISLTPNPKMFAFNGEVNNNWIVPFSFASQQQSFRVKILFVLLEK